MDFWSKSKETQRRRGVLWTEKEQGIRFSLFFCFGGDVGLIGDVGFDG